VETTGQRFSEVEVERIGSEVSAGIPSFFPLLNGGDSAILYCFVFLLFFVAGPGRWSVDSELMDTYGSGDRFGDDYGHRTARATGGRS
jgi:hypothetical protein